MIAERASLPVEAVESMFAEIGLLVLEGDAAGLAAKVSELSAERRDSRLAPGGGELEGSADGRRDGRPEVGRPQVARSDAPASLVHSPHS